MKLDYAGTNYIVEGKEQLGIVEALKDFENIIRG